MASSPDRDLSAALLALERPPAPPPLPSVALRVRLATSPGLRRLLPTRIMVRRAEAHGRALWARSPPERERARAAIGAIVGGTPRAGEIDPLARQHLIETEAQRALFWQRWSAPRIEPAGAERLREALRAERGVLLSCCHQGPFFVLMSAVAALGGVPYTVAAAWFFAPPSHDYWGRRLAHWRRRLHSTRTQRLVPARGSYPLLRALLERGEAVQLYFDMPGRRETHLLGKPVMLASGTARLAADTGALVLPLRARRAGHRLWVDVHTPLDPHEFAAAEDLHDALAEVHGRWILELPAALEDPNRPGAWERRAGAQAWLLPEQPRALTAV